MHDPVRTISTMSPAVAPCQADRRRPLAVFFRPERTVGASSCNAGVGPRRRVTYRKMTPG